MLPAAHHLVWFIATCLSLWGISLVSRGIRSRRTRAHAASIGDAAASSSDRRRRLLGLVVGAACQPACLLLFFVGRAIQRYASGEDFDSPQGPTIFHAIAAGLFVFALVVVARGLFRDSSNGRKRCPKCWYDMAGTAASGRFVCPECGHDALAPANLLRTRRHRVSIVFGTLLVLAALWVPRLAGVPTGGAKALLPTTVLIAGIWYCPDDWIDNQNYDDESTIVNRLDVEEAWGWQRWWAARRATAVIDRPTSLARYQRAVEIKSAATDEDDSFTISGYRFAAKRLSSPDAHTRADAFAIISDLTSPWGMNDESVAAMNAAVRQAAPSLAEALTVPEIDIVVFAALSLVDIPAHTEEVRRVLLVRYPTLSVSNQAGLATYALTRTPDTERAEIAQAVLFRLNDPEPKIRSQVLFGLAMTSHRQDLHPLIMGRIYETVQSDDQSTARLASRVIVNIHSRLPAYPQWLAEQVDTKAGPMKRSAFQRLARLDEATERYAMRRFIPIGLADEDPDIRSYALYWVEELALLDTPGIEQFLPAIDRIIQSSADTSEHDAASGAKDAIERCLNRRAEPPNAE